MEKVTNDNFPAVLVLHFCDRLFDLFFGENLFSLVEWADNQG